MCLQQQQRPKVLIVGAGLGGITLAILLERAGVPYEVYERAASVKPLGSALSLGSNILPLFQQLGLLDEYLTNAKPSLHANMCNEQRQIDYQVDLSFLKEMGGFYGNIVSRPFLYDLLIRQVPPSKIHFSKKIVSTDQHLEDPSLGVTIHCSDKTSYTGDILVGADGAHSGVRQALFDHLKTKGRLPASDDGDLPFSSVCLVGQTRPLDPEEFPELKEPTCNPQSVLGDRKPYSWLIFTTKSNQICWTVTRHLDEAISSKQHPELKNAEWGSDSAEVMCKEVKDFPIRGGRDNNLTIGDLIERTPKELISKVMLEEKVFDTWYSGRTVLMGDACHKLNPAGAQGAVNALQDAATLANWINVLPSSAAADIEAIFEEYRAERHPLVTKAFEASQMMSKNVAMNWVGTVVRFVSRYMPVYFQKIAVAKMVSSRPQVSFLPLTEDKGTIAVAYQPSLHKTRAILKAKHATSV